MSCSAAARSRSPGRAPAILDGSGEVELATYKHFNTEDLLGEMALERMVAGAVDPQLLRRPRTGRRLSRRFESMISIGRTTMRNVKRWRDGKMIERWTAAGMLEAEKRFYRVQGYRDIPALRSSNTMSCGGGRNRGGSRRG